MAINNFPGGPQIAYLWYSWPGPWINGPADDACLTPLCQHAQCLLS